MGGKYRIKAHERSHIPYNIPLPYVVQKLLKLVVLARAL
jgi:hypothetical protein